MTLWDMGGQDEYQLVHQLSTTPPWRSSSSIPAVIAWRSTRSSPGTPACRSSLKGGRTAIKLLVGTKCDERDDALHTARIKRLVAEGGFLGYFETSAREGHGIPELLRALAGALRWHELSADQPAGAVSSASATK